MLNAINIKNIAVVKNITINFSNGMTVITGETGAGKSIIINSLKIISGSKMSKDIIRTGESFSSVSAIFSVNDLEKEKLKEIGIVSKEDNIIQIDRTIYSNGKTFAEVNGKNISNTKLRDVGAIIISVNGQNDSKTLIDGDEHIKILDEFSQDEDLISNYMVLYDKLCDLKSVEKKLINEINNKETYSDVLRFQISEIEKAHLKDDDEEEIIENEANKIKLLSKNSKYVNVVYKALTQSESGITTGYLIGKASSALRELKDVIPNADELSDKLDAYSIELSEIGDKVYTVLDNVNLDDADQSLDKIGSRLSLISKLKRKYGSNIKEIKDYLEKSKKKLMNLENESQKLSDVQKEIYETKEQAEKLALNLHDIRVNKAKEIALKVNKTFIYLDMKNAVIKFNVERSDKLNANGGDDVKILVSTNAGEELKPIAEVASGGELSRIMLSLRNVISDDADISALIFDEIDSGVSGATSEKIGHILYDISKKSQVICVTHSPQISSLSDHHYLISKSDKEGRTESKIEELDYEGRIKELARIIGGIDVTSSQIQAAKDMLDYNKQNSDIERK